MKKLRWLREEPKSHVVFLFLFFIMRSLFLGARSFCSASYGKSKTCKSKQNIKETYYLFHHSD